MNLKDEISDNSVTLANLFAKHFESVFTLPTSQMGLICDNYSIFK